MTLHSNAVERRAFFYLFTTLWIQLDSSSVIHKLPSSSWIPGLWAYTHFMNAKFLSLSQGNPIEHAQNPVRLDSEPVNPDSEPVSLDSKPVSPDSESVLLDCESKHGWAYTREYMLTVSKCSRIAYFMNTKVSIYSQKWVFTTGLQWLVFYKWPLMSQKCSNS